MDTKIINYLIEKLRAEDIIIQLYQSKTSKSVYLKLDYGVLNSIRISDHSSKKHLKYRYNLLSNVPTTHYSPQTKRFYYRLDDIDKMIDQVLSDRNDKKNRYKEKYQEYMDANIQQSSHKSGFWKDSIILSN